MVYGSGTNTNNNTPTGNNNIDALIASRRWASNIVSFSFTSNFANDYEDELGYPDSTTHAVSFSTLNNTQRAVMREWTDMFEDVSNLHLFELFGSSDRDATIRIAETTANFASNTAYAYYPWTSVQAGDIWFNPTAYDNPTIGNWAYHTFGHELGHALGLEHGHETGGISGVAMDSNRDSMEFSLMTYRSYEGAPANYYRNEFWGYAQSLMMYDIAAIQHMYGADFTTNSGNTTYSFSTTTGEMLINGVGQGTPGDNRVFRTIWDGNGVDTYSFTNYTTNLSINLKPGSWSDLDTSGNFQTANLGEGNFARGHVFNALQFNGDSRSLIENANGGFGNDSIVGNNVRNILQGGSGNDTVSGAGGDDYLNGGSGIDTVDYRHWNGGGTYNLATGVASFPGYYDEEIISFENIITGNGNDVIIGSNVANRIEDNGGNDTLTGGGGADDFVFEYLNHGVDTITDFFWIENDEIHISEEFGGGLTEGFLQYNQFTIGSSASDSSDRVIYNSSSGDLFFDADGAGSNPQVQFASLNSGLALIASDFVVI